jgi:hypothetical protein
MYTSHQRTARLSRRLRARFGLAANEPLPKYAWPGGYPIYYVDGEDNVLCASCANGDTDASQAAVEYGINWEDGELICDDCGNAIECAYPSDGEERPAGE